MGKIIQSQRMRMSLAAVGGGLTVVLIGAGVLALASSASAGSASPSPTSSGTTTSPTPGQQGPGAGQRGPGQPRLWRGFGGGLGGGLGGVLHGTGVIKKTDGSFQSIAVQRGFVTAVSATSISVKSLDGFPATYVVSSTTKINGRNGKIADIKKGNEVAVQATVTSGTSTASRIIDLTTAMNKMKNFNHRMHQWFGGQPGPNGKPSTSPSPASSGTA